ncbi:hypothetical protein RY45_19880 [Aeromonas hydrophila]|nr:hypothetical protein RY45_19880 [Aeromonas hydrophila]
MTIFERNTLFAMALDHVIEVFVLLWVGFVHSRTGRARLSIRSNPTPFIRRGETPRIHRFIFFESFFCQLFTFFSFTLS